MARTTRAAASTAPRRETPRRAVKTKAEAQTHVKEEEADRDEMPDKPAKRTPRKRAAPKAESKTPKKKTKREDTPTTTTTTTIATTPKKPTATPEALQAKKLKAYAAHATTSPFPTFAHPTPAEAKQAHRLLTTLHGARARPPTVTAPTTSAGCGASPSVLDALVRTILSQNTSAANSTRAKRAMDAAYGRSDAWAAIAAGGRARLQAAIQCGGLGAVKSKVIMGLLDAVRARYGVYSLDHLHAASSEAAMREMLGFAGVGPKTASCVLLFCLGRESFAVDTHVYRLTGMLGWRPAGATREQAHAHLDARIPDEDKFGLHILLIEHGRKCVECRAGGKSLGTCELRKAFRKGKLKGEAGEDVKEEEEEEEEEVAVVKDEDVSD